MTRLLITGGAGFIGSNLATHLLATGQYDIRVIDNESLGSRQHLTDPRIKFIHGDILERSALGPALEGCDVVIHLAADTRVMDSIEDPVHNFETNVIGTFRLLNLAREFGVRRVINASTGGAILGEAPVPIDEGMVARPLSPYGASKLAGEGYCMAFQGAYGLECVSLRFTNIYGPGSYHKGSVIAHFFKRILRGEELVIYGDGSQIRDYLYVGDLAQGIVSAVNSKSCGVFQLGSGRPTSLEDLVHTIRQVVADDYPVSVRNENFRPGEIRETWGDIRKAREEWGFSPRMTLEEGLRLTWEWFLKVNPE